MLILLPKHLQCHIVHLAYLSRRFHHWLFTEAWILVLFEHQGDYLFHPNQFDTIWTITINIWMCLVWLCQSMDLTQQGHTLHTCSVPVMSVICVIGSCCSYVRSNECIDADLPYSSVLNNSSNIDKIKVLCGKSIFIIFDVLYCWNANVIVTSNSLLLWNKVYVCRNGLMVF